LSHLAHFSLFVKFYVNEGRGQEAVFVTGIYAPLQKLFALKGEVLDPIFSITPREPKKSELL
jgi:hypothetical protein